MHNKCYSCGIELGTGDVGGICFSCKNKPEDKVNYGGNLGWTCPRCLTVHAPFVRGCGCDTPTITSSSYTFSHEEDKIIGE